MLNLEVYVFYISDMVNIIWLCDSGLYYIFICFCNLGIIQEDKNIIMFEKI